MNRKVCSRAVLFDMDGVLLDSEIAAFQLLLQTLAQKGVELSLNCLLERYVGLSSDAIYAALIETYGFKLTVHEFREEHQRCSGNYYRDGTLKPMPGLLDFLEHLRSKGIPMAVVSSTGADNVLFALNRLSILKYFDAVIGGDMVTRTKPSPEGYRMAASYLHAVASECLAIEDSPVGIQAAKNAGTMVAGYKGSLHQQDTSKADIQIGSFYDLIDSSCLAIENHIWR